MADLAGPLMIILVLQTIAAVGFVVFVLFRVMGRNYLAAVDGSDLSDLAIRLRSLPFAYDRTSS